MELEEQKGKDKVKIDMTTKLLLLSIAVALWARLLMPVFHPKSVKASTDITCTGDLKANAWGGEKATIGGYKVDVTCTD
jgi:hypothetical protein